jgi:hypothetical protein
MCPLTSINRHARPLSSHQTHDRAFDDVAVAAVVQQSVRQPKNTDGDAGRADSSHAKPRSNRGTGGDATSGRLHVPYGRGLSTPGLAYLKRETSVSSPHFREPQPRSGQRC